LDLVALDLDLEVDRFLDWADVAGAKHRVRAKINIVLFKLSLL
jgi:hypothetical protein